MPIAKVPVVHKFGIISYSQRLELQERLLKQSYPDALTSRKASLNSNRKGLEISEDFIQQFNNATSFNDKDKYEDLARKILERIKRRCGLRTGSEGQHVNLPLAWTELSQLAQCKGSIQEDCLDVLIVSLDHAPLEHHHIPALFFLAETMLYWLRTDVIHQPYLRTAELKLLKMGQLVFTRLFYHHMTGDLQGEQQFKTRLYTYLDGLRECQDAYSPYPNALLSLRFIIEVGKIILSDVDLEAIDPMESQLLTRKPSVASSHGRYTPKSLTTSAQTLNSVQAPSRSSKPVMMSGERSQSVQSSHSAELSTSVHSLSPSLWHSLDVWRCTNHLSGGLNHALRSLAFCGAGLANESWIDSICSMMILTEAAKTQLSVLKTMQGLAVGRVPRQATLSPPTSKHSQTSNGFSISSDNLEENPQIESIVSSKNSLSDIFERSEEGETEFKRKSTNSSSLIEADVPTPEFNKSGRESKSVNVEDGLKEKSTSVDQTAQGKKSKPVLRNQSTSKLSNTREVSFDKSVHLVARDCHKHENISPGNRPDLISNERPVFDSQDTGNLAEDGSVINTGRGSKASSVPTFTNQAMPEDLGIRGWHWETAILYTELMASICLHGNSSLIQKMALMGENSDLANALQRGPSHSKQSSSLLDLVKFHAPSETRDGGCNDWSWRVRFGAIQSLVKICRCLTNDKPKEGLRNVAWAALMHAHSTEKDDRVLEALKVGEVFSSLEKLCNTETVPSPCVLGGRIAAGLAQTYLPHLPPVVAPLSSKTNRAGRARRPVIADRPVMSNNPLRTSIREEIDLASFQVPKQPSFNTRTSFDLRRIVEDQWRKELQEWLTEDEADRQKHITDQQTAVEEQQRKKTEKKTKKFKQTQALTE